MVEQRKYRNEEERIAIRDEALKAAERQWFPEPAVEALTAELDKFVKNEKKMQSMNGEIRISDEYKIEFFLPTRRLLKHFVRVVRVPKSELP